MDTRRCTSWRYWMTKSCFRVGLQDVLYMLHFMRRRKETTSENSPEKTLKFLVWDRAHRLRKEKIGLWCTAPVIGQINSQLIFATATVIVAKGSGLLLL